MYGSVFEALSDNFSGVAPMTVADDGSVALANTTIWRCIVDNVDLYNKVLSTNALDTRVTNVETSVKELEELKEKMGAVVQDSGSDAIDNYSEVIAFLKGYKDSETLQGLMGDVNTALQGHDADIANLELKHLNPAIALSGSSVVEYVEGGTSKVHVQAVAGTDDGEMKDNGDFSNISLNVTSAKGSAATTDSGTGSVGMDVSYSAPVTDTVTASGTCVYKGVNVAFPTVTKTVHCVKASYIGYSLTNTPSEIATGQNIQKVVKKSLAGTYTVVNGAGGAAYLCVAVPKDGNVNAVTGIMQRSSMNVNQPFDTVEADGYTFYVCRTAHNEGTYTFVIS